MGKIGDPIYFWGRGPLLVREPPGSGAGSGLVFLAVNNTTRPHCRPLRSHRESVYFPVRVRGRVSPAPERLEVSTILEIVRSFASRTSALPRSCNGCGLYFFWLLFSLSSLFLFFFLFLDVTSLQPRRLYPAGLSSSQLTESSPHEVQSGASSSCVVASHVKSRGIDREEKSWSTYLPQIWGRSERAEKFMSLLLGNIRAGVESRENCGRSRPGTQDIPVSC